MTKLFTIEFRGLWKGDGESRALVDLAVHTDGGIVIRNNGLADGQAQTGPFSDLFGGKERIVDLIKMLLGMPVPESEISVRIHFFSALVVTVIDPFPEIA